MKIKHFEIELLKRLKRVNFIFLINLVPFNGKDYKKQKRPETSYLPTFRFHNKCTKIYLLVNKTCSHLSKIDDAI